MPTAVAQEAGPSVSQAGGGERKAGLRARIEQTGRNLKDKQAAISKNLSAKIRRTFKPNDPENVLRELAKGEPPGEKLPKTRTKKFLMRDRLTKADIAYALHDDNRDSIQREVTDQKSKLTGNISRRQDKRIFRDVVRSRQAVDNKSVQDKADLVKAGKLSQIDAIQVSKRFNLAREQEFYTRRAEHHGKEPGKLEKMRIERDLTVAAMKGEPITREEKAQAKAVEAQRVKAEEQQKRDAELKARKEFMKHKDYQTTLVDQLKLKNRGAIGLEDPKAMAEFAESALKETDRIIAQKIDAAKTTEGQSTTEDRAKAVTEGRYHAVLAEKIMSGTDVATTPDLDQAVTDEAIRTSRNADTPPEVSDTPGGRAESSFDFDSIFKGFGIEADSPQADKIRALVDSGAIPADADKESILKIIGASLLGGLGTLSAEAAKAALVGTADAAAGAARQEAGS